MSGVLLPVCRLSLNGVYQDNNGDMGALLRKQVMTIEKAAQPLQCQGEFRYEEPLARYTSWRVGGPAERMFLPADKDDLVLFLKTLPSEDSLFWLGLGSNVLVRDGGIRGAVICTRGRLKVMRLQSEHSVFIEAGVPCAHVARFCSEQGLAGAEFLAGIPGTFGGALAMNAGAFGGEAWGLVKTVQTVNKQGLFQEREVKEFEIGYRHVIGRVDEWFLSATLVLSPEKNGRSLNRIRELLAKRAQTQPIQLPSCGSVFRNPSGDYAARLIEASGLKGHIIGGASVSEKHANFIVNNGGATSAEIEKLIHYIIKEVEKKQGIILKTEVCVVGDEARKG